MNARERGSSFITIIILAFVLFAISAGFMLMMTQENKINRRSYDSTAALNLAEAGLDYAVYALSSSGIISTWSGTNPRTWTEYSFATYGLTPDKTIGDFEVKAYPTPVDTPTSWLVVSTGYVPNIAATPIDRITRTVRLKLASSKFHPFQGTFFGNDHVKITGSCETDSYNSGKKDESGKIIPYGPNNKGSNGDIVTYGTSSDAIDLSGNTIINGDVATGPGGTVDGEGNVTGNITHDQRPDPDNPELKPPEYQLPALEVPPELTSLLPGVNGQWPNGDCTLKSKEQADIPAGNWKLGIIKLSSNSTLNITGPAKIYLTGSTTDQSMVADALDLSAHADIICNGKVEFYVDGKVELTGQATINDNGPPGNCLIWGTSGCESIKITGGSNFYGAVYAPAASIDPSGGGDNRFGAFIGKSVDCSGSGQYHYDEALAEITTGQSTGYKVEYWQEK